MTLFNAGFRSNSTPFNDERDRVVGRYSSVTVTAQRCAGRDNRTYCCNEHNERIRRNEIDAIRTLTIGKSQTTNKISI